MTRVCKWQYTYQRAINPTFLEPEDHVLGAERLQEECI